MRTTIGKGKQCIGNLLHSQAYMGRPSALGNTFVERRDGSWVKVIAKYRRWPWSQLQEPDILKERVLRRLLARAPAAAMSK